LAVSSNKLSAHPKLKSDKQQKWGKIKTKEMKENQKKK
jgi:hypothetical protein